MERTRISSGWKIAILGGCAVVAVCGMAIFALLLVSVLNSQSAQQPVYSESTRPDESVPQQEPDSAAAVSDVLTGHRWMVHSPTLGTGVILEAVFKDGGSFDGIVTAPPDDVTFPPSQQINGKWYIAGPLLYLEWDWIWLPSDSYHEQIPIEITSISQNNVQGVDKWWRLWEFERMD